jgi:hypothetical protein
MLILCAGGRMTVRAPQRPDRELWRMIARMFFHQSGE